MKWSPMHVLAGSIVSLAMFGCGSNGGSDTAGDSTVSGDSKLPRGGQPVNLDPSKFTTKIDNPYWPLSPGSRWVYREVENGVNQKVVVTVTGRTKVIDGVRARGIHDVVTARGQPVEKTYDWYAQDSSGNVWYLGEDTKEYDHGKVVSTAGSWEAGVGGAQAGVIMPGQPEIGVPTARSTTRATPRTTQPSPAPTRAPRCRSAASTTCSRRRTSTRSRRTSSSTRPSPAASGRSRRSRSRAAAPTSSC
jgi:hypothetical protein